MKSSLKFLLVILTFAGLGVNSCQKDFDKMREAPMLDETTRITSRQDSSPTPELDLQAFDDKVDVEYEFEGRTLFEHLYYFQTTRSFEDYIPASLHEEAEEITDEIMDFGTGNDTYESMLTYAQSYESTEFTVQESANFISAVDKIEDHVEDLLDKVDAGDFQSFGQIWFYLKTQESAIAQDGTLSQSDKQILLLYNSLLRNYLKYEYGRGNFSVEERGGGTCILGL